MENGSSEKKVFSAADFTFYQKYSLFNKPIIIQYLILALWITSGVMGLYYMLYDASYDDFVRMGILPYNLEWMIIVLASFIVIGCGFLLYPVDPLKYEKLRLEQHFDHELVHIEEVLEKGHFSQAITLIESLLTDLNHYHIHKDRKNLLQLLQKAEINQSLENQITNLRESFNSLSSSQQTMRHRQIQTIYQANIEIVHGSLKEILRDLSSLFSSESQDSMS